MKFSKGDKVRICGKSCTTYHGKIGVVADTHTTGYTTTYQIRFETDELLWYREGQLSHYPEKPTTSESEEIIMYSEFAVAEIRFLYDNKTHSEPYALFDSNIGVHDKVVVCSGCCSPSLAEVVSITTDPLARKRVTGGREIICKVDFTEYEVRQTNIKRAKELQRQMDSKVKNLQDLGLYEMFSKVDPEMKALLDEYKSLTCPTKVCNIDE